MKNLLLLLMIVFVQCTTIKKPDNQISSLPPVSSCGLMVTDTTWYSTKQKAPLINGLGSLSYRITTSDTMVQNYFDQGLRLSYAFNHAEAARSFFTATMIDSSCAMCHWGYAYVLGPNYNAGMEADNYERAYHAVQQAIKWSGSSTEKEKALIQALSKRYVATPVDNRRALDSSYSAAMGQLHLIHPDDPEIAALYVESIMDLHPWDLWEKNGTAKPWTPAIIYTLEKLIDKYPDHPGLHHFYIHAVEASHHPEKALKSARKFDDGLVPQSGHLMHMPSHIYIRTGDYHAGSISNFNAVKVDSQYVASCHAQGIYPLSYFPHNFHFLAATATLEGNKEWALMGAEKVSAHTNTLLMKDPSWSTLQHYYLIPYFVLVKFGLWDSILRRPEPQENLPYVKSIRSYARGMAYLGKKEMPQAKKELELLESLSKDSSLAEMTIWGINKVTDIVHIAALVLMAEIKASEKEYKTSISLMRNAIALEDKLNYNEPPDWFFSVRHHLGAILVENKNYDEGIKIYLEDLGLLPKNGWALHGLKNAYVGKKDLKSVQMIEAQLAESWQYADIKLEKSRIL